jgi:gliding motility-associated-like protein
VNEPTPLDLSLQTTDALCYQSSTGFADLTVTGSTPPYSYSWNNGAYNTEDLLNVPAGNYNVTITDNQGCVDSILGKIDQPDSLNVVPVIVAVSCVDQTDGAISLEVFGGTAPYAYSWSNNESSPNITNLSAGVMQVTITDANNCVANRSFVVDASTLPCVNPVNTFTPNGDLINDTWVIDNMHLYPNASVQVFNKWGNRVYESVGLYTPWDGTYNENPLPAEVYYFIIELNDPSATKLTGTLTIIR